MIKQFAILENDVVVNTMVIDDSEVELINTTNGIEIPDDGSVQIGYTYSNGEFIDPNPPINGSIFGVEPDLSFEEIEAILQGLINNGN